MDEVVVPAHKRRKRKGKLDEDRMDFDTKIIEHTLSEDALAEHFPQGYKRLPDEVYKKLERIPAVFEVHEHHIAVYKGKNGKIVKAEHPKEMLNGSIATPSIVSAVIHGKYTNAVPLYRQEQEFARNDVNIVVVKLFCNICGLNLLDCCLEAMELSGFINGASHRCAAMPLTKSATSDFSLLRNPIRKPASAALYAAVRTWYGVR